MDSYAIFLVLFFVTLTYFLRVRSGLSRRKAGMLPPGPRPLPIVGNLLQLGSTPHQTLAKLSKTYGPLMSMYLGSVYTVVVSSPEMAREVFLKYGTNFSSRHIVQAIKACDHDKIGMSFLPLANPKWRDMRKICKEHMFANHSLEGSQGLREEKLQQLLGYVQKCCNTGQAVKIGEASFTTTLNLISATLFSVQATDFESKATQEIKEIIEGITTTFMIPNFADYFPILKPFDPQGVLRKANYYFGELLAKIDCYIVERLESRKTFPNALKKNDLLETLLDISEGSDYQITNDDIKHLLLDLYIAGAETSAITIEWIMSELLLNPDKQAKLKEELKSVVGEGKQVQESDVPKLPYLQAVIKEAFRYHPPGPLLVPRAAVSDQDVGGYMIPKGTAIITNVWAMGRDPNIWPNPDSFEPERFMDKRTDFKGQDFELIPFGAGKRICPGVPLANRILHMITAALIHNFDWKLQVEEGDAGDNAELFCASILRRAVPLRAIPIKH